MRKFLNIVKFIKFLRIEYFLRKSVIEIENIEILQKLLGWRYSAILEGFPHIHEFKFITDINQRRIRDAEVLGAACRNVGINNLLEIGTSSGHTTALMSVNAPTATIHTVNIPPEEATEGGKHITYIPNRHEIGFYYRESGCTNIRQILANTAYWEPDIDNIDVAFIDGCHDSDFVFQDTVKTLQHCRDGAIILWHDFDPQLIYMYDWIASVCTGIYRLHKNGIIKGPIIHLRNSWIGLYRVGGYDL